MKFSGVRIIVLAALVLTSLSLSAQQPTQRPTQKSNALLSDKLNDDLPKWLSFSGEVRGRFEEFAGGKFQSDNSDFYFLERLRLNLKIQPADWLRFVFQGQDAHALGKDNVPASSPYQDAMDLRLGYLELGDVERKPVSFRAGRQELAFGDERLIGSADWLNTARSFDALRGVFRWDGFRIDAFAASVVKIHDGQFNEYVPGTLLYGLYASTPSMVPKATVEPYFLWRRASNIALETGGRGVMNFGTVGFRWVGQLPDHFDFGTEMARQAGSVGTDTVGAWAGHWVLGYTLSNLQLQPRFSVEYNCASGDSNSTDGHRGTFDQLYPTGHDKYGLADQVGWKNIRNVRGGVDLKPAAKWQIRSRYEAWWLADPHDALYDAASNVVAKVASGTAGRFVGQELDFVAVYDVSRAMKAGAGYGHIFPGTFLKHATPGESYDFPYAMLTYRF
jgi:hypothetical protein